MKYIQTILLSVAMIPAFLFPFALHTDAATLSFTPVTVKVTAGQTFRLAVTADPQGTNNYTVKASMKFPPDMLSMQSWTFDGRWLPLREPGYDEFSNVTGTLVRTAGYTNGFGSPVNFGTAVFTAKKSGTAVIQFQSDSLSLDAANKNTYTGANTAIITIGTSSAPLPKSLVATPTLPEQLFDIHLVLTQRDVQNISQLTPRLLFHSFGSVPTPVVISFDIVDSGGKVIMTKSATTTVETDSVFNETFAKTDLPAGDYLLRAVTVYNGGMTNEFDRIFSIVPASKMDFWWLWAAITAFLLISLIILVLTYKSNEE